MMNFDLTLFEDLIKERTGLVFKDNQANKLLDVIRDMMTIRRIESFFEYFQIISKDEKQFYDFVGLLTTNETYFYREPTQFKVLCKRLIPEILARKKIGEKVGILSAGCSTGAEPYSIVIALMEQYGNSVDHMFNITGFDIDQEAIKTAKEGIYGKQAFRILDKKLRDTYFKKIGSAKYEILPDIKKMVKFNPFNLLSTPYPDQSKGLDIVFYRNVSIYFEPEKQKKIFSNLSQALNEKGYLITSPTETLPHDFDVMTLVEMDGVFLYCKDPELKRKKQLSKKNNPSLDVRNEKNGQGAVKPQETNRRSTVWPDNHSAKPEISDTDNFASILNRPDKPEVASPKDDKSSDPDEVFNRALSLAKGKQYKEALDMADVLIETAKSPLRAYVLKAGILINLQKIQEAKQTCAKLLELDGLCLEGYLLSGVIAEIEDDIENTRRLFKKALYIDPSCWLAHYFLAESYRLHTENEKAGKEYEIVVKILEKGNFNDHENALFNFSFSADQILHLCRHNMKQLRTNQRAGRSSGI